MSGVYKEKKRQGLSKVDVQEERSLVWRIGGSRGHMSHPRCRVGIRAGPRQWAVGKIQVIDKIIGRVRVLMTECFRCGDQGKHGSCRCLG